MIWLEPNGVKVQEIMGPVVWKHGETEYRLIRAENHWIVQEWYEAGSYWRDTYIITDHEAACLWRDHARRWLEERHYDIRRNDSGWSKYQWWQCKTDLRSDKDYDAALIAAVLAVGDQEK